MSKEFEMKVAALCARHEELLEIESTDFKKIGKIQYKKKFE